MSVNLQKKIISFQVNFPFALYFTTLIYFTIPIVIFLLGWIQWYFSLPLVVGIFYHLFKLWSEEKCPLSQSLPLKYSFSIKDILLNLSLLTILGIWVYFSGVSASGFQNGDFDKHNSMLYDLINNEWPVTYNTENSQYPTVKLVYYLAYYLPGALWGKIFSYLSALQFMFFWAYFGILLSFAWFLRFIGTKPDWRFCLLFILYGGLDIIGLFICKNTFPHGTEHIEWWSDFWQYSANPSLLYWVPQHTIAGWALTALFIEDILKPKRKNFIFLFSLAPLWSAFVMLGLIPLLIFGLFTTAISRKSSKEKIITKVINLANILGALITFICAFYYLTRVPDSYKSWIWHISSLYHLWPKMVLFEILEFGLYAYIIYPFITSQIEEIHFSVIFKMSILALILIPLYKFGMYNDFAMRSSIPSIFILQIAIGRFLLSQQYILKRILMFFLFLGFFPSMMENLRPIALTHYHPFPPHTIVDMAPGFSIQYIGKSESFFFEYLAKKSKSDVIIPSKLKEYWPYQQHILQEESQYKTLR